MADARAHDRDHASRARSRSTAGTETCASTFATATAVPGRRPVQRRRLARSGRRRARRSGTIVRDIFSSTTCSKRGSSAAKYVVGREAVALRPHRLVAGGAAVARLDAGQLPDDPVGGLDQPVGGVDRPRAPRRGSGAPWRRTTPTRSCRRSVAATARPRSRATALIRSASGCAAWCFQSFTQACGSRRSPSSDAERRPVGGRRQHRAGGEVDADADDVGGVDAGLGEERRDRRPGTSACSRRDPGAPSPARGGRRRRVPAGARRSRRCGTGRRPSRARGRRRQSTSSARPDSVPKSMPIAYLWLFTWVLVSRVAARRPPSARVAQ